MENYFHIYITRCKKVVNRVAVLATEGQVEQLLAVPKVASGAGADQCNACIR